MVLYFIKSTFLLLIFYVIYKISLERNTSLHFKRYFLLISLGFALLFPLVNFQFQVDNNPILQTKETVLEQMPFFVIDAVKKESSLDFNYLKILYAIITSFFVVKFSSNLFYLWNLKRKSTSLKTSFGVITLNDKVKSPFTFIDTIFVNATNWQHKKIEQAILYHEQGHVVQKHTFDVLFVELIKIFLWFQPFLYIYKRLIQENHEYLADAYSLSKHKNINHYQHLILNYYTTTENVVALSSSIHFNNLKKRFIMMKNVKKGRVWETIFYSLTVLITYSTFVGIEAKAAEINKIETKVSDLIEQPVKISKSIRLTELIRKEVKDDVNNDPIILTYIKGEKSSGSFNYKGGVYFYTVDENLKVSIYDRYGVVQNEKDFSYELKAISKIEKEKLTFDELNKSSQLQNDYLDRKEIEKIYAEAHNFVDKKAEPKEGMMMFIKNFAREFKAPENINSDEIKMRLKFIVETDGSFSNILTPQEYFKPDESYLSLQEEGIRTLKTMPKWNPAEDKGEVVRSTFTLPITIRLNPDKTDSAN